MHRLQPLVPSAHALYVFEAAARRGSFSAAAQELNVSQPAVSKTIKALERSTGLQLFFREKKRIELTGDGVKFQKEVLSALDQIYNSITALRKLHTGDVINVSLSSVFIHIWLLPRIGAFRAMHPDIPLRFEESYRESRDLVVDNIDLSSRLGNGAWPEVEARHFVSEEVWAVCSPDYLATHAPVTGVEDLFRHSLLHFDEPYRSRIGWREWFERNGVQAAELQSDFVFTDSKGALEAALFGQGIALSWKHLALDYVRSGRLVRVLDRTVRTGLDFYIVSPAGREPKRGARLFRDWLIQEIERDFPLHD